MKDLFDAFWRAILGCLHPRVILWSLLPLLLAAGAALTLGWLLGGSVGAGTMIFALLVGYSVAFSFGVVARLTSR